MKCAVDDLNTNKKQGKNLQFGSSCPACSCEWDAEEVESDAKGGRVVIKMIGIDRVIAIVIAVDSSSKSNSNHNSNTNGNGNFWDEKTLKGGDIWGKICFIMWAGPRGSACSVQFVHCWRFPKRRRLELKPKY